MENWSKKMQDEATGLNPARTTLKAIYKANTCW